PDHTSASPLRRTRRRRGRRSVTALPLAAHSARTRPHLWLTGILPQQQPFRQQDQHQIELLLRPDEDEQDFCLIRLDPQPHGPPLETTVEDSLNERIEDAKLKAERITPWTNRDYMTELTSRAERMDMTLAAAAQRF